VHVPAQVRAWERIEARVAVRNPARRAILPVALELSSAQGLIESWGIEGRSTRWGVMTPGRITGNQLEVLAGIELQQQQPGPPSQLYREVNAQLIRIDPLLPSASVELSAYFDAAYQHGNRIDATLQYITLDPLKRTICTARESTGPLSFVDCSPVKAVEPKAGLQLYLSAEELKREPGRVTGFAPLAIRHPAFDVDTARARTEVASGPYGYDTITTRWILVDERGRRTRVVSEQGAIEDLPGQWLDLLVTLNHAKEARVSWNTQAVPLTGVSRQTLSEAGIRVTSFTHKDYTSPVNVVLTVSHAHVSDLGRLLHDLGVRLEGLKVMK
jgi:hypothetical protein